MEAAENEGESVATSLLLMPRPLLLEPVAAARDCTADSSALGAGAAPPPCDVPGTEEKELTVGSGRRK
jgi:hypothetical protein